MNAIKEINQIIGLEDSTIQQCLKHLTNQTVAVCLIGGSPGLKKVIFSNMSERACDMIKAEMKFNGKVSKENKQAFEQNMLQTVNQVLKGSTQKKKKARPFNSSVKKLLKTKTIESMTPEELGKVLAELSSDALANGVLSLEKACGFIQNDYLIDGIRLAIDGTDPELVRSIMSDRGKRMIEEKSLRLQQTVKAVLGINAGNNPRILGLQLEALQPATCLKNFWKQSIGADLKPGQLKTEFLKLTRQKPLRDRNSVECVLPFCWMTAFCRMVGMLPFYDILNQEDLGDDFFSESVLGFTNNDPVAMKIKIEQEAMGRIHRVQNLYDVLLEAVSNIQMGYPPELQVELVKSRL